MRENSCLWRSRNKFGGMLPIGMLCLFLASAAQAQTTLITVHIPSKPLAEALIDFALQANLSISDSGIDFQGKVSHSVDGTFSQENVLRLLLADSGYGFTFLSGNAVRINLEMTIPQTPGERVNPTENVIVTATKHAATAQSLPYSIAVTMGAQLEDLGVQSFNDLTPQVAGLTATNLGPGEDKVFVRGLSDSVLPGLSESMVGFYLGETRIADDAPDPDLKLVDIDRIEVLRGPQGTLYGAGSLGGLVRIIPHEPDFNSYQTMAEATVSSIRDGGISSGVDGMINVPVVPGIFALRAVGYFDNIGGYIDEIRLGINNANRTYRSGARLAMDWQPEGVWTISANLAFQKINARDSQYYLDGLPILKSDNYLLEPHSDSFLQMGITATGELGWAEIVSSTSYLDRTLNDRFDATLAWPSLTGFPLAPSPFVDGRAVKSYSHETRLVSADEGNWNWLAGAFLTHRDEDFNSALSGQDASGAHVVASRETREDRENEIALYGEATYAFTNEVSLTVGARAFDASHNVNALVTKLAIGTTQFKGSNKQFGITPKLVLKYQAAQNMMFYAQYGEGYRLGGINIDGPTGTTEPGENTFDSDLLRNYEIGSKLTFFDKRITLNAAGYLADWTNVQTDQIGPDGSFFILNAGNVRDLGSEIDITLIPLEHLSLQGNFFWNNAKLSHTNPLLVASEGLLPGAPDVSFGVSGRYDIPINAFFNAYIGFDYSYVGSSHLGFDENLSPRMGGYHLTNLRFGLDYGDWRGTLFVNNVTNNQSNTFAFGNPFNFAKILQITPPRPRTIGLSVTWLH